MSKHSAAVRLNNGLKRGRAVRIFVDGRPIEAHEGETIATALVAAGHWTCQRRDGQRSGVFCNIGLCHGCLMTVDGQSGVKTCVTDVTPGQQIETQQILRRGPSE